MHIHPRLCLAFAVPLLVLACKKKDEKTTMKALPEMVRLEAPAVSLRQAARKLPLAFLDEEERLTNAVTIDSLRYPIGGISLSYSTADSTAAGDHAFPVYNCPGTTNDECLVELTGDALQNLLKDAVPLDAPEGTYNKISFTPCVNQEGSNVRIKFTGSAVLDGVTWYTSVAEGLSQTGPAEEVSVSPGIGCSSSFYLPEQLVIGDGEYKSESIAADGSTQEIVPTVKTDTIPIKLYFDISNVAYASGGTSNTGAVGFADGCYGVDPQHPHICLSFPDIAGTVDEATPTVKSFLVSDTGTTQIFGDTVFGLYFGSSAIPFGAYTRAYYNGEVYIGVKYQTLLGPAFKQFELNADSTIKLRTIFDWMVFPAFSLETHTGEVILNNAANPAANADSPLNGTQPYLATKLN